MDLANGPSSITGGSQQNHENEERSEMTKNKSLPRCVAAWTANTDLARYRAQLAGLGWKYQTPAEDEKLAAPVDRPDALATED
jgi:hypothetical protein